MRMKYSHPVIVGGTNDDGSPRHELCRMDSEFEIPEYTKGEAPITIRTSKPGSRSRYIHSVDGKFYHSWLDGDGGYFEVFGALYYLLLNGHSEHIHFEPFHQTVNHAAHDLEVNSGYAVRVNVRRELLKREQKTGMREVTKACLKAPILKSWRWLSPDADEQIARWREIAAEKMANIILVDGVPVIRCHEPSYVVTTNFGDPQIKVASKQVYQHHVDKREKLGSGLDVLGPTSGQYGNHYFSATQYEDAVAFATSIGWKLLPGTAPSIRVFDESVVTDDFLALETVRHARMLLTAGEMFAFDVRSDGQEPTSDPLAGEFIERADTLMRDLLAWQEHRDDVEQVRATVASFSEFVGRSQFAPVAHGRSKLPRVSIEFRKQLEEFTVRDEQAEVRLDIPAYRTASL
ncbi:hypothetical protein O9X98_13855 [Agrobacterium salinitolerans]|nr:hypothetical protein [Agrobacterium salinitolerans]